MNPLVTSSDVKRIQASYKFMRAVKYCTLRNTSYNLYITILYFPYK